VTTNVRVMDMIALTAPQPQQRAALWSLVRAAAATTPGRPRARACEGGGQACRRESIEERWRCGLEGTRRDRLGETEREQAAGMQRPYPVSRARSQGSNPWQTQGIALDVPLPKHFPLDPIASLRYKRPSV